MWFTAAPKPQKIQVLLGSPSPQGSHSPYILGDTTRPGCVTLCPSLIQTGSKTAEKNSAQANKQTNRQTDRHYENNGHLAVNQYSYLAPPPGTQIRRAAKRGFTLLLRLSLPNADRFLANVNSLLSPVRLSVVCLPVVRQ